jgi:hypothetical protein
LAIQQVRELGGELGLGARDRPLVRVDDAVHRAIRAVRRREAAQSGAQEERLLDPFPLLAEGHLHSLGDAPPKEPEALPERHVYSTNPRSSA